MKLMETKKQRTISITHLLIALLLILPMALNIPTIRAEGVKTLDYAAYQNLADVDDELITKFVETNLKPGASLEGKFNINVGYEIDIENFPPQQYAIDGDVNFRSSEDKNAMLDLTLQANFSGEEAYMTYGLFLVNHDNSPEHMLLVAYTTDSSDPAKLDETNSTVQKEIILRTDLDQYDVSSLTAEDIKKFTNFKVVEDHGETVDILALISIEEINAFMTRVTSFTVDGETVDTIELERANATFKKLGEELGIEKFVFPVSMTLEKSTGHLKSASGKSDGIIEIIEKSYELDRADSADSPNQSPIVAFDQFGFSFEISNVEYDVTDKIIIPQHVLQALEAQRTAQQTP